MSLELFFENGQTVKREADDQIWTIWGRVDAPDGKIYYAVTNFDPKEDEEFNPQWVEWELALGSGLTAYDVFEEGDLVQIKNKRGKDADQIHTVVTVFDSVSSDPWSETPQFAVLKTGNSDPKLVVRTTKLKRYV